MMQKLKDLFIHISYDYRYNKALEQHNAKVKKYMNMSSSEIEMLYIEIVTRYEYAKLKLVTFISIIFTSIVMGSFKYLLNKVELFAAAISNSGISESQKLSLLIIILLFTIIIIVIAIVIIDTFHQIKKMIKEKTFLEEFRKNHDRSQRKNNVLY